MIHNFFSPLEERLDNLEESMKNRDIYSLRSDSGEPLTEKQMRFITRAAREIKYDGDLIKIAKGSLKHNFVAVAISLLRLETLKTSVADYFCEHIEEFPAELQAPIMATICYRTGSLDNRYVRKLQSILEAGDHERFLTDKMTKRDSITVYKAVRWDQSVEDCIEDACWSTTLSGAAGQVVMSSYPFLDRDLRSEVDPENGIRMVSDVRNIKDRVFSAEIAVKDILVCMNPAYFIPGIESNFEIVQNGGVYDVNRVDARDLAAEMATWMMKATAITDSDRYDGLDEDDSIHEIVEDLKRMEKQCVKAGMPERGSGEKVTNRRITDLDDFTDMLSSINRFNRPLLRKKAKTLMDSNKGAVWVYRESKGVPLKKRYSYRAVAYNHLINDFFPVYIQALSDDMSDHVIIHMSHKTVGSLIEANGYSCERIDFDKFKDYTVIAAYDIASESRTLEECMERCEEMKNPEKKVEKPVYRETKKETVYLKQELSEEEKTELKKAYQNELDSMYQEALFTARTAADSKVSEIERLKEQNDDLRKEIEKLKLETERLQKQLSAVDKVPVITAGTEKEKFAGEIKSFVMSAIEKEIIASKNNSRRNDVLRNIYDANTDGSEDLLKEKAAKIKKITKGYRKATDMKNDFEREGFIVQQSGGHPAVLYSGDKRYIVAFAGSASDVRAGDNLAREIIQKFF